MANESVKVAEGARKVPRFVSCLVKGPLGCLAFFVGAGLALVLLVPPVAGRVIDRTLERWFSKRYAGELELGDAWLGSLWGEQRVERILLRDPLGEEILRAKLTAPPLSEFFSNHGNYGPVEVRVERMSVIERDGLTNLERALEALAPEEARTSDLRTDQSTTLALDLWIARLRYASEREAEDTLVDLRLQGALEWGPLETRLALETQGVSEGAMHARLRLERSELGLVNPWKGVVELEGVPTVLARALCPALRPITGAAGSRIDRLRWSFSPEAVALECADAGVELAFAGKLEGGIVVAETEPVVLGLACHVSALGLSTLFPFLARVECEANDAVHELRLHHARWPLDGDWAKLAGELELSFASAKAALAATSRPPLIALLGPLAPRLPVAGGELDLTGLQIPLENGWVRFEGRLELGSGAGSVAVAGEVDGAPLERLELGPDAAPPLPAAPDVPSPNGLPQVPPAR
jgi:hypothetical protein